MTHTVKEQFTGLVTGLFGLFGKWVSYFPYMNLHVACHTNLESSELGESVDNKILLS